MLDGVAGRAIAVGTRAVLPGQNAFGWLSRGYAPVQRNNAKLLIPQGLILLSKLTTSTDSRIAGIVSAPRYQQP